MRIWDGPPLYLRCPRFFYAQMSNDKRNFMKRFQARENALPGHVTAAVNFVAVLDQMPSDAIRAEDQKEYIKKPVLHNVLWWPAVLLFSKLNKLFFGYFDPENILLDNKNKKKSGVTYAIFRLKRHYWWPD